MNVAVRLSNCRNGYREGFESYLFAAVFLNDLGQDADGNLLWGFAIDVDSGRGVHLIQLFLASTQFEQVGKHPIPFFAAGNETHIAAFHAQCGL